MIIVVGILLLIPLLLLLLGLLLVKTENKKGEELKKVYDQAEEKCMAKLISVGPEKIKIIKTFREYTDWDISLAKSKIEMPLPAVIIYGMPVTLVEELRIKLKKLDTIIEKI